MSWLYFIALVLSLASTLLMAVYGWWKRDQSAAKPFTALVVVAAFVILCYLLLTISPDEKWAYFWTRLRFVGLAPLPVLYFLLIQEYCGVEMWLSPRRRWSLFVVPFITIVVIWGGGSHHLFFRDWEVHKHGFLYEETVHFRGWFWVHTLYSYALFALSFYLLIKKYQRSEPLYRRQTLIWFFGVIAPLVTDWGRRSGVLPQNPNLLPISIGLGAIIFVWGLFSFRLLDIMPIAYSTIFKGMKAAVIVVDTHNRIIEMNPAAVSLTNLPLSRLIGQPMEVIFAEYLHLIQHYNGVLEASDEIVVGEGDQRQVWEFQIAPLYQGKNLLAGRLLTVRNISDAKHAEDVLHHSEAALNDAQQIAQLGYWELNVASGQAKWSNEHYAILGIPAGIPITHEYYNSMVHEADRERVLGEFRHFLDSRMKSYSQDYRVVRADGQIRAITVRARVTYSSEGVPQTVFGIAQDITERKQAEELSHAFLNDMKALQELHLELSQIEDLEMVYLKMVELGQQRLGIDRLGLFLLDPATNELQGTFGVSKDGQIRNERYFREAIRANHWTLDILNSPNHTKFWEEATLYEDGVAVGTGWKSAAALWDGQAAIGYLVADNLIHHKAARPYEAELIALLGSTFGHLIRLKQATDHLKQSEMRFRTIFEASPIGKALTSPQGKWLQVNPAACEILGYSQAELVGIDFQSITHPDDLQLNLELFEKSLAGGSQNYRLEKRFIHKNGRLVWVLLSASLVKNGLGEPQYFITQIIDITDLKEAEQQQAKLMAQIEAANRDLKDFAYIVSHDLKAPLRGVGSIASWLASDYQDRLDDEGRELLELLNGRVKRMDALINGILEYSRIGRTDLQCVEVDLDELLCQVIDLIVPHKCFTVQRANNLPTVRGDRIHLQQIFQNLISNSVKHMDKPAGEIHIASQDLGDSYQFSIRDNGPGIEARHFTRIFQIFQTLTARDQHESTGVGLTIVKRIVENYGGKIWLESTIGEGTTFYFTLPKGAHDESN